MIDDDDNNYDIIKCISSITLVLFVKNKNEIVSETNY